jgi:FAD:protein FMN transferase
VSASAAQVERARWQALGTSVELLVSQGAQLEPARSLVEHELARVDWACSRFREDSELTRVNAHRGRVVRVDPLLVEATEVALRAAELTDGDVDPTIGGALELVGYDRDWSLLGDAVDGNDRPEGRERQAVGAESASRPPRVLARMRPGWQAVEVDRERSTMRLPAGTKLDLGATAKAWAADRCARLVHEATGCGVLVSLGGDISIAGPSPASGWRIHVTDDHRSGPDAPGQTISITGGGLATSSTTVRRWRMEGRAMHHILDPATGAPAVEVWRTVSVAAGDCVDANIAATAAIVRGEGAPEWLAERRLPARLVGCDGELVKVGAWPCEGERS